MTFDPFTATLEEAKAQPDAWADHGAVLRWGAAQQINSDREELEKSPIDGVARCVRAGLVAPNWLAYAFLRQYGKVLRCEVASWDEAFGPPFAPGKHLSTYRLQRHFGWRVNELFTDDEFRGRKALPRTPDGRKKAAALLGLSEKQVRTLAAQNSQTYTRAQAVLQPRGNFSLEGQRSVLISASERAQEIEFGRFEWCFQFS
jgi:hypothetical protein